MGIATVQVGMDEPPLRTLFYYMVSEMPGTLAIVRYHARDDHDRTTAVAEDTFFDTPDDFCRCKMMSRMRCLLGWMSA